MPDGSILFNTYKDRRNIRKIIENDNISKEEAERIYNNIINAPAGKKIRLSNKFSAIVHDIETYQQLLKDSEMDHRLILLMAYNYLNLLLGEWILIDYFDFIRKFIRNGKENKYININSFTSREYDCYHRVYSQIDDNGLMIKLIFFKWLIYNVHIPIIRGNLPDIVYVEDLKGKRIMVADNKKDANNNFFRVSKVLEAERNGT